MRQVPRRFLVCKRHPNHCFQPIREFQNDFDQWDGRDKGNNLNDLGRDIVFNACGDSREGICNEKRGDEDSHQDSEQESPDRQPPA
jgi:hypothetical protein